MDLILSSELNSVASAALFMIKTCMRPLYKCCHLFFPHSFPNFLTAFLSLVIHCTSFLSVSFCLLLPMISSHPVGLIFLIFFFLFERKCNLADVIWELASSSQKNECKLSLPKFSHFR